MREQILFGLRILLVEDDPLIALDVEDALVEAGAQVIGPYACLREAERAALHEQFDLAVLDVDLGREEVFPAAEILKARGIPFIFYTGRPERTALRQRFSDVPVCAKPSPRHRVLDTLGALAAHAA